MKGTHRHSGCDAAVNCFLYRLLSQQGCAATLALLTHPRLSLMAGTAVFAPGLAS